MRVITQLEAAHHLVQLPPPATPTLKPPSWLSFGTSMDTVICRDPPMLGWYVLHRTVWLQGVRGIILSFLGIILTPPSFLEDRSLCQRDRERGWASDLQTHRVWLSHSERETSAPPSLCLSVLSHYFVLSAVMCLCVWTGHMGDDSRATTRRTNVGVCVFSTGDYTQSLDEAQERWREKLLKIKARRAAASKCRLLFWSLWQRDKKHFLYIL